MTSLRWLLHVSSARYVRSQRRLRPKRQVNGKASSTSGTATHFNVATELTRVFPALIRADTHSRSALRTVERSEQSFTYKVRVHASTRVGNRQDRLFSCLRDFHNDTPDFRRRILSVADDVFDDRNEPFTIRLNHRRLN